jgi:hypothetical protein
MAHKAAYDSGKGEIFAATDPGIVYVIPDSGNTIITRKL